LYWKQKEQNNRKHHQQSTMTERRSGRMARGVVDLFGTETEEPLKDISTKKSTAPGKIKEKQLLVLPTRTLFPPLPSLKSLVLFPPLLQRIRWINGQ